MSRKLQSSPCPVHLLCRFTGFGIASVALTPNVKVASVLSSNFYSLVSSHGHMHGLLPAVAHMRHGVQVNLFAGFGMSRAVPADCQPLLLLSHRHLTCCVQSSPGRRCQDGGCGCHGRGGQVCMRSCWRVLALTCALLQAVPYNVYFGGAGHQPSTLC